MKLVISFLVVGLLIGFGVATYRYAVETEQNLEDWAMVQLLLNGASEAQAVKTIEEKFEAEVPFWVAGHWVWGIDGLLYGGGAGLGLGLLTLYLTTGSESSRSKDSDSDGDPVDEQHDPAEEENSVESKTDSAETVSD